MPNALTGDYEAVLQIATRQINGVLGTLHQNEASEDAAIGAPPRALGVLRQACSHNLRTALRAEIDKDFVKLPVHEIEKHLAG
jgi:protein required for attachment to host cells